MARAKPITVDSPTTEITHQKVLIITVLNAGSPIASLKFRKPIKPPTIPDLDISLKDSLNTIAMGKTTKTAIRTMLGNSQRYGSHLRLLFSVFIGILLLKQG